MFEIPISQRVGADPRHVPIRVKRREDDKDDQSAEKDKRDKRRALSETGNLLDIEI